MRVPSITLRFLPAILPIISLSAQQPVTLGRITGPIVLDGRPDEPAWAALSPLPLVQYVPNTGAEPTQRSDIRLGYDDHYIYVGARLFDTEPDKVQIASFSRDEDNGGDFLNIMIDGYNDNENGLVFSTTPAGARLDYFTSNDAEGSNAASISWNGVWDCAARRDQYGWTAEMRIPLSTLRFQVQGDSVVMGMIVNRLIGRSSEREIFPAIQPRWAFGAFKPSQAQDVVLHGVASRRPIYLTPYVEGGRAANSSLDATATTYQNTVDFRREAGGDFKIGVSDNLTLDLTANTDFAEVESDDERLNLDRFPLFFPERRQFFLERAGVFDVGLGGNDRLFHSRRIGLTDQGQPIRILGGARTIGRFGGWDIGALDMQTQADFGLPTENLGVLRLRHRVFNPNSAIGATLTTRLHAGGGSNQVGGVDGTVRLSGVHYLVFDAARSNADPALPDSLRDRLPKDMMRIALERRSTTGLGGSASVRTVGGGFDPGLGFVERRDVIAYEGALSYGFLQAGNSWLRIHTPSLTGFVIDSRENGKLQSSQLNAQWTFETPNAAKITLTGSAGREQLVQTFRLTDTLAVPPGSYPWQSVAFGFTHPIGWRAGVDLAGTGGKYFDGHLFQVIVTPTWRVSPHLVLSGTYEYDRIRFPARAQQLDSHIGRLRAKLSVDTRLSTSGFIQVSSVDHVVSGNFRVRYNFREGVDLWVVYNHALNLDRSRLIPSLPTTQSNELLIKWTYMFRN